MQSKAANLTFPYRSGDTDNTPVRLYDCGAASQAHAIPSDWYGKNVLLTNETANLAQFYISDDPDSTCDETLTGGNPTASPSLGGSILGNMTRYGRLPYPSQVTTNNGGAGPKTYYLVRASATDTTLRMELTEQ